jgi:hypothetical protein
MAGDAYPFFMSIFCRWHSMHEFASTVVQDFEPPAADLFRPYLNLSDPGRYTPLHAWRAPFAFDALQTKNYYFRLQRTLPASFRNSLTEIGGLQDYNVDTPLRLSVELQTPRWSELCDQVKRFGTLSTLQRALVSNVLNTLGFFDMVLSLNPRRPISWDEDGSLLALTVAIAQYVNYLDGRNRDYSIRVFEEIATHAPHQSVVRLIAILHMIVQNARLTKNVEAVGYWNEIGLACLNQLQAVVDPFMVAILSSRYYRGASFYGFMIGDPARVVADMNRAEMHANAAQSEGDPRRDIIRNENFYPLMESRSKEAIWIGDHDLAEARLRRVIEVDPYDAKIWIELAELLASTTRYREAAAAYHRAARLGPPGREIAWFMAGQCHEKLDETEMAMSCYWNALQIDPLGISSLQKLRTAAETANDQALAYWAQHTYERFHS